MTRMTKRDKVLGILPRDYLRCDFCTTPAHAFVLVILVIFEMMSKSNANLERMKTMKDKAALQMLIAHHKRRAESAKVAGRMVAYREARRDMLNAQAELWKLRERAAK